MGLFLPGLGQGAEYGDDHLGPLRNTGLPPALGAGASCSWRAGAAPLTRATYWGHHWRWGRCGTAGPELLPLCHPPLQGHSSHPGAKWVQQQRIKALALLFVLLLLGRRLDTGMCGAGAAQEWDCPPNPLGSGSEGGPSAYTSCGGCWGRCPASPLLCEGRGLISVCPLLPHKSLPRSFGGGRGPSCGQLQPGGPRMDGGHLPRVQLRWMQRDRR